MIIKKIIVCALICCLSIEQAFAQVAGSADLTLAFSAIPPMDRFRPVQLRSVNYDRSIDGFNLFVDKGDMRNSDPAQAASRLMEYFQLGITLPDDTFWVNLRPDARDAIIDPRLEQTDLGKVLLEADLSLKRDLASAVSPKTAEGRRYWKQLYGRAEALFGSREIAIPTVTRPWIVPGEIIVRQTNDSVYVYKAGLEIRLEQDHLKGSGPRNSSDSRLDELNSYSTELIRRNILPQLTRKVNSSRTYAGLRQVYYSLILAKWFKDHFRGSDSRYARRINTGDLSGLRSRNSWSKDTYFEAYRKSFNQGEYQSRETATSGNGTVVRTCASGGISGLMSGISSRILAVPGKANVVPKDAVAMRYDGISLAPMESPAAAVKNTPAARASEQVRLRRQVVEMVQAYYNNLFSRFGGLEFVDLTEEQAIQIARSIVLNERMKQAGKTEETTPAAKPGRFSRTISAALALGVIASACVMKNAFDHAQEIVTADDLGSALALLGESPFPIAAASTASQMLYYSSYVASIDDYDPEEVQFADHIDTPLEQSLVYLGFAEDAESLTLMKQVLGSDRFKYDEDVTVAAASSLAARNDPEGISFLAGVIWDADRYYFDHKRQAVEIVGRVNTSESRELLAKVLASDARDMDLCRSEEELLHMEAAMFLADQGDSRGGSYLTGLLGKDSWYWYEFGRQAGEAMFKTVSESPDPGCREFARGVLSNRTYSAQEKAIVAAGLAGQGDAQAIEYLKNIVSRIDRAGLGEESKDIVVAALGNARQDAQAQEVLYNLIIRPEGGFLSGQYENRELAALALAQSGDERGLQYLRGLLNGESRPYTILSAIDKLGQLKDVRSYDDIYRFSQDPSLFSEEWRIKFAGDLAAAGDARGNAYLDSVLSQALQNNKSDTVKLILEEFKGGAIDEEGKRLLRQIVNDMSSYYYLKHEPAAILMNNGDPAGHEYFNSVVAEELNTPSAPGFGAGIAAGAAAITAAGIGLRKKKEADDALTLEVIRLDEKGAETNEIFLDGGTVGNDQPFVRGQVVEMVKAYYYNLFARFGGMRFVDLTEEQAIQIARLIFLQERMKQTGTLEEITPAAKPGRFSRAVSAALAMGVIASACVVKNALEHYQEFDLNDLGTALELLGESPFPVASANDGVAIIVIISNNNNNNYDPSEVHFNEDIVTPFEKSLVLLAQSRDESSFFLLKRVLNSRDFSAEASVAAASSLALRNDAQGVAFITNVLWGEDYRTNYFAYKREAVETLGRMNTTESRDILAKVIMSDADDLEVGYDEAALLQMEAAEFLAGQGDLRGSAYLIDLLKKDYYSRYPLGFEVGKTMLQSIAESPEQDCREFARAMLANDTYRIQEKTLVAAGLAKTGDIQGVEFLKNEVRSIDRLHGDGDFKDTAVAGLGNVRGDSEARELLYNLVFRAEGGFFSSQYENRELAAFSLAQSGDARGGEYLIGLLNDGRKVYYATPIVDKLGQLKDPAVSEALYRYLENDANFDMGFSVEAAKERAHIAGALAQSGDKRGVERLDSLLAQALQKNDTDSLTHIISEFKGVVLDEKTKELLRQVINDNAGVAQYYPKPEAAALLMQNNDPAGLEYLNTVVKQELNPPSAPGFEAAIGISAAAIAAIIAGLRKKLSPAEEEKLIGALGGKTLKAVAWDADGVIYNTTPAWVAAWARVFRENNGPEMTLEFYNRHLNGRRSEESFKKWIAGISDDEARALKFRLQQYVLEFVDEQGIQDYSSTVRQIEQLVENSIPTAVGSASDLSPALLGKVGLLEKLSALVTAKDVSKGKPDPETFLTAVSRLGVAPSEAIVVGDAVVDMEAAKAGGFGFIIGLDRGGDRQALYEAGADLVVEDISEIDLTELIVRRDAEKDGGVIKDFLRDQQFRWHMSGVESGDWEQRKKAAFALGNLKDSRAVEPLIALLADENSGVMINAIEALAKIGDIRGQKPIVGVLGSKQAKFASVRQYSAWALSAYKNEDSRHALAALLFDDDKSVRWEAKKSLRSLGWEETTAAEYTAVLKGSDKSRILTVLSDMGGVPPSMEVLVEARLLDADADIRNAALSRSPYQYKYYWSERFAVYGRALAGNDRALRLRALAELGKEVDSQQLRDLLVPCCNDPDPDIRAAAIRLMDGLCNKAAVAGLKRSQGRKNLVHSDLGGSSDFGGGFGPDFGGGMFDGGAENPDVGGIDLRQLQVKTQAMSRTLSGDRVPLGELESRWRGIRLEMTRGGMPYIKMKEFVISCSGREDTVKQLSDFTDCVAELLRSDEERALKTSEELKEIVTLLG